MDRYTRIVQNKPLLVEKTRTLRVQECVGRRIVLLMDPRANGGTELCVDSTLVIEGHWRGLFHLYNSEKPRGYIRRVSRHNVEVLDG